MTDGSIFWKCIFPDGSDSPGSGSGNLWWWGHERGRFETGKLYLDGHGFRAESSGIQVLPLNYESKQRKYTWRVQRPKLARQCEKRVFLCAQDIFYSVPPMLVLYFIIIIKSLLRYQPLSMTHVLSSRPQRSAWSNILSSLSIVFSQHSMPRQQLRDHEMAHILISPVREMTSNTSQQGDIESAPVRTC